MDSGQARQCSKTAAPGGPGQLGPHGQGLDARLYDRRNGGKLPPWRFFEAPNHRGPSANLYSTAQNYNQPRTKPFFLGNFSYLNSCKITLNFNQIR
jgi:hypothetical protein